MQLILIPTCNRPYALAMTLTSLASQTVQDMRIHISDQSDDENVPVRKRPIDAPHVLWQRAQPQHNAWSQHA